MAELCFLAPSLALLLVCRKVGQQLECRDSERFTISASQRHLPALRMYSMLGVCTFLSRGRSGGAYRLRESSFPVLFCSRSLRYSTDMVLGTTHFVQSSTFPAALSGVDIKNGRHEYKTKKGLQVSKR